ncbi:hypothetical protein ACFU5O_15700 [Streptomyces sp. NPDC057445]|uniref:hypothetical protein n=1 Tax=Streptomyces sp. NPDC057445 TaxID=3346136 RepID=UPI0036C660AF
MSGSQGTGTPHRPMTAALSRHWKMAVLAAAGFVTMVGTTTIVAVTDVGKAEAQPASAVKDDGKVRVKAAPAPVGEGVDTGSQDGDYWAERAGNPGSPGSPGNPESVGNPQGPGGPGNPGSPESVGYPQGSGGPGNPGNPGTLADAGANGAVQEGDQGKEKDSGPKGDGGKDKGSASKGDGGKDKGSASKGDEGKEKGSASKGDEGKESKDKGYGDHDKGKKYGDRDRHHGDHGYDKKTFVECDPNDLIQAITEANDGRGGVLLLAEDCTYTLTANQDGNGLPRIIQPITIHGNGATIARAANADQFRLFEVGVGGDLKLSDLTLTRGKAAVGQEGGAINVNSAGRLDLDHVTVTNNTVDNLESDVAGGILNEGITAIRDSTLSRNAGEDGAAIYNESGSLEITGTKITGNTADADDGFAAIFNDEDATARISKSVISNNHADSGGGIHNDGVLEVEKSGIVDNFALSRGGGIQTDDGSLYVRNSTIKGNTAGTGGGLNLDEPAVIEDSKITENTANDGNGGGVNIDVGEGDEVAIRDSKVSDNQAPDNEAKGGGIFVSEGSTLTLTDVKVTENLSDEPAGGIQNNGTVNTNGKIRIIDNVPTNCDGSAQPVPNCFG